MATHTSATTREETPHSGKSTQQNATNGNRCINIAYRRRAESVIADRTIDAQTRALIRYALETGDPWLAELLRRVDAGQSLLDTIDFSQEPQARNDDDFEVDKIEAHCSSLWPLSKTLHTRKHWRTQQSILRSITAPNGICAAWLTRRFECYRRSCSPAKHSCRNRTRSRSRVLPPARESCLKSCY